MVGKQAGTVKLGLHLVERFPESGDGLGVVLIKVMDAAHGVEHYQVNWGTEFDGLMDTSFRLVTIKSKVEVFGLIVEVFVGHQTSRDHELETVLKIVLGVLLGEVEDTHWAGEGENLPSFGVLNTPHVLALAEVPP